MKWDIFCAVVDNYGDIGVTWRLARQLVAEHGLAVRLWVDDLRAFSHLWPKVDPNVEQQHCEGVEIRLWSEDWPAVEAADVVIEAFACHLPAQYIAAMEHRVVKPLWLNLEYLSAEDWVAGCHALPSPQAGGLQKYFFFPGFVEGTGGLLRERGLIGERDAWQADEQLQRDFLSALGVPARGEALRVSLFAYENAGVGEWLDALAQGDQRVQLLVPQGRVLADVTAWLGVAQAQPGAGFDRGALSIHVLPFMSQVDYDRLLWSCDINLVRGEDSFVRAQWAARPMLWHIYQQAEGAHWDKLEAFMSLYAADLQGPTRSDLQTLWRAWNASHAIAPAWQAMLEHLPQWCKHAQHWAREQAKRVDLAAALVQFHRNSL